MPRKESGVRGLLGKRRGVGTCGRDKGRQADRETGRRRRGREGRAREGEGRGGHKSRERGSEVGQGQ